MSLLLVVDVGLGVCRVSRMHYSFLEEFLSGDEKIVGVQELPFDDVIIIDRKSKSVISSQSLVQIPKGWRTVIL